MSNNQIFIPVNILASSTTKKLFSKASLFSTLITLGVLTLAEIAFVNNYLMKPEKPNIVGFILISILFSILAIVFILKVCLQEKTLMKYYKAIKEADNKKVWNFVNSIDIDHSFNNIPVFLNAQGYRFIGVKLTSESLVGKSSKDKIDRHYDKMSDAIKAFTTEFPHYWHFSLTGTTSKDTRWDYVSNMNSKNGVGKLKRAINEIIIHNQNKKNYFYDEYYFAVELNTIRPSSKMVEAFIPIANTLTEAKFKKFEFVDSNTMTEICEKIYLTDKHFNEIMSNTESLSNTLSQMVFLTAIINKDKSRINITGGEDDE